MLLILGSFIAGFLTVLAPCVLPLLPIIIGGSVSGNTADRTRPLIITASLAVSLLLFTLLLKATTVLIGIPPSVIVAASGIIIVALGLATLFPTVYARVIARSGVESRSQKLLGKGFSNRSHLIGPIITGAALGPVFSSCSPVYGYILATVLPVNFAQAMIYITSYILGLSVVLLLIGYFGQRFINRIKFASDPRGAFQRILGVIFIIVGLLVMTGYDKKLQTFVSEKTPFNFDKLSAQLIPDRGPAIDEKAVFNVEPYDAPELAGLQNWINSNPQTLAELRGKVVYVDFWTYSCINCIRNNPYIQSWYDRYQGDGFTVLGIHAPEFAFEKVPANVEKAVHDQKITYPVALDNDFTTWAAFENQYWPAGYLIDADGQVRRVHYGEGEYDQTEDAIRQLLMEKGTRVSDRRADGGSGMVPVSDRETKETYLGFKRASNYAGSPALAAAPQAVFTHPAQLGANMWSLGGNWETGQEKIVARGNSTLRFNFSAKEMYIVAASANPQAITVTLDGKPIQSTDFSGQDVAAGRVTVGEAKLYRLVSFPRFEEGHVVELSVPAGVELNVFTFGS